MWNHIRIADFGKVITGKTPSSDNRGHFGDKYPFITPTDMNAGRLVETERAISEEGYIAFRRQILPPRSVCFVCIGATIGKICMTSKKSLTNQQVNSIVVDTERHDPYFVYYLLSTYAEEVKGIAGGAATPIVNKTTFENLQASAPSLPTQRKIAAILSAYDDLIENNLRRIKILEEMAQNLYRGWFVKFRFPGHEQSRFTDSSLGRIPEGWEVNALSEYVNTQYGYTESAQENPVGPKYLRGMDINKTTYIDWEAVPFCPISDDQFSKYQLAKGDIVIIRMADPGKVGIVEKDVNAVFASYLVRLSRTSNCIGSYYLFHFLISERYQGYITGASTGTTRKSASAGVLTGIDVLIPPESILVDFELQIQGFRGLLNNLLDQISTVRRTRDLLLPKLISGEADVSELDIAVPEEGEV
jgi:type I restriction enzyme S subunit